MSKEQESKSDYPLSNEENLYDICETLSDRDILVVPFCYGDDTIHILHTSYWIYNRINMSILDEETFQESLYTHVFENIPIEIDSTLFAEYSKSKIMPYPEITKLYKAKGIGTVLWHYMKGKRYIPYWPIDVEKEEVVRIYKDLDSIRYVIYLAFQHDIFFYYGEELTYWLDDKGVEIMKKAWFKPDEKKK